MKFKYMLSLWTCLVCKFASTRSSHRTRRRWFLKLIQQQGSECWNVHGIGVFAVARVTPQQHGQSCWLIVCMSLCAHTATIDKCFLHSRKINGILLFTQWPFTTAACNGNLPVMWRKVTKTSSSLSFPLYLTSFSLSHAGWFTYTTVYNKSICGICRGSICN